MLLYREVRVYVTCAHVVKHINGYFIVLSLSYRVYKSDGNKKIIIIILKREVGILL